MEKSRSEKAALIIEALESKKAENISYIDIAGKSTLTDAIIICNGNGELHNRALADHLVEIAKSNKIHILGKEGMDNAKWILIDFGEIIVHIFNSSMRDYYKIEELWSKNTKTQDIEQDEN
ncbi:MAG TPA: ribosome silencing factor [Candidatus Cloacimonadota bacterium]|mgnify:FL=1|jgi:ribosome-associated protein|nr:ribosome silencing factor [Candidatus Cloacimonadales bacterium]HPY96472.1 ribosome silencing factor [Candidatus Cloacimonadota bacterium]HQB40241.1 ribosome silencing factor [Candidatus Cloacimonadota bacterium]